MLLFLTSVLQLTNTADLGKKSVRSVRSFTWMNKCTKRLPSPNDCKKHNTYYQKYPNQPPSNYTSNSIVSPWEFLIACIHSTPNATKHITLRLQDRKNFYIYEIFALNPIQKIEMRIALGVVENFNLYEAKAKPFVLKDHPLSSVQ